MEINETLDELFDSWQSDAYDNGDADFVFDGLLNDSCFDDSEWWDSNLRIAFVTKDPYFQGDYDEGDLDGEDYREYDLLEMAGDHRFWRNIMAWAYGLIQTDEDEYPDYDEASDYENMEYIANNIPVYIGEYGCVIQTSERSNLFRNYYLEYVCRAAHTYNLPVCIWDNNSIGSGDEHHGYFNHNDGSYINDMESLVKKMIEATTSDDAAYTLESIYNSAPK